MIRIDFFIDKMLEDINQASLNLSNPINSNRNIKRKF